MLSALVALTTAHLVAAFLDTGASPLGAVGDAFIDLTPRWLKDAAIAAFGVNDKAALLVGMVVVIAVLAAATGVLARRSPLAGAAAVLALGGVGAIAGTSRADATSLAAVPSLVGAAVGAGCLTVLVRRLGRSAAGDVPPAAADRRSFLRLAAGLTAVAALAAAAGSVAGSVRRTAAAARDLLTLPRPVRAAPAVPAGAQSPVAGVVDVVTANEDFYRIDTAFVVPQVDPATWRLRVHGLVEREVTLTFDELLDADLVEAFVTLTCVSNPIGGDLAGNARWLGLPVRDMLARARPLPGADMVLSRSADGFTASTPLAVLTDDRDALLAVGMNGEPLPLEHGFPVRMVVPGLYGYVSATKWLVDLEVTRFADQQAYWTQRGWSELGPIKTASRIEVPRAGARVAAGDVAVGGTAWAQHTGVTAVEVQVDDGPWEPVRLGEEISVDTWRQWSWQWEATPGEHTLRVRATDAADGTQTGEQTGVLPDGATGWHEVAVTVTG
ncbi:MAG TPA: molybdopterin-dependent oxidoreductase [Actinotalea sp.]|nr:molybdopterin-dependent oxidoreductase [Actinotalea sp.]